MEFRIFDVEATPESTVRFGRRQLVTFLASVVVIVAAAVGLSVMATDPSAPAGPKTPAVDLPVANLIVGTSFQVLGRSDSKTVDYLVDLSNPGDHAVLVDYSSSSLPAGLQWNKDGGVSNVVVPRRGKTTLRLRFHVFDCSAVPNGRVGLAVIVRDQLTGRSGQTNLVLWGTPNSPWQVEVAQAVCPG